MLRYLTNKVEGNANASDAMSSSYKPPDVSQPKSKKVWACDVCKKTFPEYEEACRHEDECRQQQQQQQEQASSQKVKNTAKESVLVVGNESNEATALNNTQAAASLSSQGWSCDVCQEQFADYDEACRHEEQCREKLKKKKKSSKAVKSSSDASKKPVHPFFAKDGASKQTSKKRAAKQRASDVDAAISDTEQETTNKTTRKRKASKKQTEPTKKSRATKATSAKAATTTLNQPSKRKKAKQAPIADIFNSNKGASQLMAEHRAAEFVAKRRADAERERQRQKRRQEQKQQKLKESNKALENAVRNKPCIIPPEVRFPVPSHVTASEAVQDVLLSDASTLWIDQDLLSEAQGRLGKTLRHTGSDKSAAAEPEEDCTALLPTTSVKPVSSHDPLQQALSDLLVPPENVSKSTAAWCDKYSIQNVPADVCGAHNQETARELLRFVDEWKVERGRAHERRAEKQRALLKRKKKRRYREDDLWEDSDEEDGLRSVCLLTGPTGSGKTSLVHAVARQSECVVLEINTTERRGGAALKNAIEEATQSDSSLDMLKKNQTTANEDPLVDSEDEEEESATKGSSLIVVLIDEVDIIFEDEGDAGFWAAMSTLTKKAKCPIFLTANVVPDSLLASHIRYLHLETSSPKPDECVAKMRRILKSEGLSRTERFAEGSAANKQLSLVAQLCKCDLRRMINELQLFATAPPLASDNNTSPMECEASMGESDSVAEYRGPIISDISPREVSPHDLSLLTIQGKYFTLFSTGNCPEMELKVSIGNQLCPAVKVLDDSTILATCPPCSVGPGVTDSGVIESTGRESRTSRFAPVSIQLFTKGHALSRSDAIMTSTTELCDGTPYTSLGRQWNIQYAFPPPRFGMSTNQLGDSDEESAEEEFGCDEVSARSTVPDTFPTEETSRCVFTKEDAEVMLDNGVREWKAVHSESETKSDADVPCAQVIKPDAESAQVLNALSSLTELSSDAAFLEDGFELGTVPFLAGVVPGCGASLVNDVSGNNVQGNSEGNERKLLRDANARPPNFERLYSLGWNEEGCFFGNNEAYMRYPSSTSDRQLVARSELLERGLSRAISASSDSCHQDDHHEAEASESLAESIKLNEAPRRLSDEELFVRPLPAPTLLTLPDELRRPLAESGHKLISQEEMICLPKATEDKVHRLARLFADLLEEDVDPIANRLLCDIARLSETTISSIHDRMKGNIFLDYLPALCNISMHERAAEHAFQALRESDPETAAEMTGRGGRTTRRSGKTLERRHYFVSIRSCSEDSVANEIATELAKEAIHYAKN